jgi:hypothetical protein
LPVRIVFVGVSLLERQRTCHQVGRPTVSAPADVSVDLIVTARIIAEMLAGWVGVPAEGLLAGD